MFYELSNFTEIADFITDQDLWFDLSKNLSDNYNMMLYPDGKIMRADFKWLNLGATKMYLTAAYNATARV